MVDPQVGKEIPNTHVGEAVGFAKSEKDAGDDDKTEITQENELGVLGLIQRAVWVEMVDTLEPAICLALASSLMLLLMVVVASDISKEVQWPAEQLLSDRVNEGSDWGLLGELVDFMN